jgi:hypothetical protein
MTPKGANKMDPANSITISITKPATISKIDSPKMKL